MDSIAQSRVAGGESSDHAEGLLGAPARQPPQQAARESLVFREADADARNATRDALIACAGTFASIIDDPEADPVERFNAEERLRAFQQEIERRERVDRFTNGTATRYDDQYQAWLALAELVKQRVSVPDILALGGVIVTRTGRSRGRDEFHSGCPLCRDGVDRLVSWDGPNGRAWCRQCRWSADAIGAATLIAGPQFRDCVRWLAEYAGLAVNNGR